MISKTEPFLYNSLHFTTRLLQWYNYTLTKCKLFFKYFQCSEDVKQQMHILTDNINNIYVSVDRL